MCRRIGLVAVAALITLVAGLPAQAQLVSPEDADHPVFGRSLFYGTGFINTPNAFVPDHTTIYGTAVGMFAEDANEDLTTFGRGSAGVGLLGFLEGGATVLQDFKRYSFFGKIQLLQQNGLYPAIAGGVLNFTTVDSAGRYGFSDPFRPDIQDYTSFYGVATWMAGPGGTGKLPSWILFSLGWGSGLFAEDVPALSDDGQSGGVFGALAFDFMPADNAYIRAMVEHDGMDTNVGLVFALEGMEIMFGAMSLDEGGRPEPLTMGEPPDPTREGVGFLYNQTKGFVAVALDLRELGGLPWIWKGRDEE